MNAASDEQERPPQPRPQDAARRRRRHGEGRGEQRAAGDRERHLHDGVRAQAGAVGQLSLPPWSAPKLIAHERGGDRDRQPRLGREARSRGDGDGPPPRRLTRCGVRGQCCGRRGRRPPPRTAISAASTTSSGVGIELMNERVARDDRARRDDHAVDALRPAARPRRAAWMRLLDQVGRRRDRWCAWPVVVLVRVAVVVGSSSDRAAVGVRRRSARAARSLERVLAGRVLGGRPESVASAFVQHR